MRRDPTELRRALMRIAAQQAGYFSAAQAVEVGYSYQVQSPVRSILDTAAAGVEVDQLTRTIHDALELGLLTARSLRAQADNFGSAAALAIERALRQEGL